MATCKLPLEAGIFLISYTPGSALNFSFQSDSVDLTGWNLKFSFWLANQNRDGPTGDVLFEATGSPNLVLTGGSPSIIAIKIPLADITAYTSSLLWGRLERTDAGSERILAEGWIQNKPSIVEE